MHIAHCVIATQLSVRLKHLDTVLQREGGNWVNEGN